MRAIVLAGLGVALAAGAPAAEYRLGDLHVRAAWSRATFGPGGSAVAYMTIDNDGSADALTGMSCSGAGVASLHDEASGTMTMPGMAAGRTDSMPLLDRIVIPAHGHVTLRPGGLHAMLMDMQTGLSVGQSIPCVLHFLHAGALAIVLTVGRAGATTPPAG